MRARQAARAWLASLADDCQSGPHTTPCGNGIWKAVNRVAPWKPIIVSNASLQCSRQSILTRKHRREISGRIAARFISRRCFKDQSAWIKRKDVVAHGFAIHRPVVTSPSEINELARREKRRDQSASPEWSAANVVVWRRREKTITRPGDFPAPGIRHILNGHDRMEVICIQKGITGRRCGIVSGVVCRSCKNILAVQGTGYVSVVFVKIGQRSPKMRICRDGHVNHDKRLRAAISARKIGRQGNPI